MFVYHSIDTASFLTGAAIHLASLYCKTWLQSSFKNIACTHTYTHRHACMHAFMHAYMQRHTLLFIPKQNRSHLWQHLSITQLPAGCDITCVTQWDVGCYNTCLQLNGLQGVTVPVCNSVGCRVWQYLSVMGCKMFQCLSILVGCKVWAIPVCILVD